MTEVAPVGPSIHSGAVTSPEVTFALAAGHLAHVGSGEVSVGFEEHDAFELVTWDPVAHDFGATYTASDFGAPTVAPSGDSVSWSSPTLGSVTLTFEAEGVTGEVGVSVSYLPGTTTATLAPYAIRLMWLMPKSDDATLVFPAFDGRALYRPHRTEAPFGIYNSVRGGYPGNFPFLGSNAGSAFLGYAHWFDESTGSGVLWRLTGQVGRGVVFDSKPQGDAGTLFSVYLIPDNNKLGVGDGFTATSALSIEPVAGDWWDGALRYALDLKRETHPGLSRGLRSDPATTYPSRGEAVKVQADITGGIGVTDWNRAPTEITRLRDYLGSSDLLAWITQWHRHPQGDLWPQWDPPEVGFVDAATAMDAAGAYVVPYTYPEVVHQSTTEYLTSNPPWSGLIMVDDEGNPLTLDLPASPTGPPDSVHAILNSSRSDARAAMVANWSDLQTVVPGARGIYLDTWPQVSGADDHSSTLPVADRGVGSGASHAGIITTTEAMRDGYRANDSEFLIVGEGFSEAAVSAFDVLSLQVFDLSALGYAYLPLVDTIWGPFVRYSTFGTPSMGILGTQDFVPIFAWYQAVNFVRGVIPTVPQNLVANSNRYLIPQSGEDGYTEFLDHEQELYDFASRLFVDPADDLKPFLRGTRLRPLPGDLMRTVAKGGFELDLTQLPAVVPVSPAILTSVCHTSEGSERLGILLANWTTEEASFDVEMSLAEYPILDGEHATTLKTTADPAGISFVPAINGFQASVSLPARSWGLIEIHGVSIPEWWPWQ